MVTERALVFQKTEIRFARNIVLYSLPESPDIIETSVGTAMAPRNNKGYDKIIKHRLNKVKHASGKDESTALNVDQKIEMSKAIMAEGKMFANSRSIVGLFSQFDA